MEMPYSSQESRYSKLAAVFCQLWKSLLPQQIPRYIQERLYGAVFRSSDTHLHQQRGDVFSFESKHDGKCLPRIKRVVPSCDEGRNTSGKLLSDIDCERVQSGIQTRVKLNNAYRHIARQTEANVMRSFLSICDEHAMKDQLDILDSLEQTTQLGSVINHEQHIRQERMKIKIAELSLLQQELIQIEQESKNLSAELSMKRRLIHEAQIRQQEIDGQVTDAIVQRTEVYRREGITGKELVVSST